MRSTGKNFHCEGANCLADLVGMFSAVVFVIVVTLGIVYVVIAWLLLALEMFEDRKLLQKKKEPFICVYIK